DEAVTVALAQGLYQASHFHGNEILRGILAQSTGRNCAKARDTHRVDDLGYGDLRIFKVIRQSRQRRVRNELVNTRISEIAVDEQGRLRGIEGKRRREVPRDETGAVPSAHCGNQNNGVLSSALLIDLGSQLAEHLDGGFSSLLGVDDASLPELVCAQQLVLVIGHARDGFLRLDLLPQGLDLLPRRFDLLPRRFDLLPWRLDLLPRGLDLLPRRLALLPRRFDLLPRRLALLPRRLDFLPQEGSPRRAPSSRSRSSHELQISTILSGFFQRL